MQAITINANEWSDAGHAVNHLYDILYMMGRAGYPTPATSAPTSAATCH